MSFCINYKTNGVQSSTYKIGVRVNIKRGTKLSDTVKYDEYILVNEQITKISQLICAGYLQTLTQ